MYSKLRTLAKGRKGFLTLFSLFTFFVNLNIFAQEHWSPYLINDGEGGQVINDIAVSKADPNFIMFGTDVGGLFRSTDGGANWIPTGLGLSGLNTLTLQIDQSNANRVFMVSGSPFNVAGQQDGIWMSTDKGITWSQVLRDDNNSKNGMYDRLGEQLVIDGSSYDAGKGYCTRMYYSSATGTFYTSTDGGSSWNTSTALTVNAYHLSMNNSTGDIFAWSTNNDLLRSTDKGSSFQKIYTGIDWPAHVRNVGNKTYMVVHHDKVYVSTDNGNSFTATGNNGWPASNSNSYIERFEVSPANNNNMTLLVGDSRYYSNDGGNNWGLGDFSNLGHSVIDGIAGKADRAFAWHATDGNIGWDTRHDFVTKTFDGGKIYKWSNKGYTGIFLGQRNTFHFNSQNPDYITLPSCDWNGATTYDAGKTWYDVSINGKWYGWNFSAYAVSPGVWFFAECEDNNFYKPVLRITRDYGKTYETQNLGQGWLPSTSSYLDPTDVNVWFYNTYRSTDAGKTWNGTDKGVVVLTHDNKTNALYGYSYDTGWAVFKSTDKGATFQKVFSAGGGDLRDIAVDNVNGFIYACHDFYVEKYNVSTGTFETMGAFPKDQYGNGPTTRSVAVDPVDPKIVYVANGGHFYAPDNSIMRSKDGGATWESITPSPRNNNTKYATPGGGGAIDALWCRVNPKTRELLVGTNDFGFWTIGAPGSTINQPPTVSLTAPVDKATYLSGADVALTATAADADGTIAKVEFYNGTTLLGTSNASPYGFTWKAVTSGSYQLTAKAYDDKGASTVSTIVNITVSDAAVNQPPTVSLTAPADKATYVSGTDVALTATAADADGTIAKVEFYNGTTLLGTSNASPYGFTWKAVTAGNYQLTAKAYDDKGSSTVSTIVNITVSDAAVNQPPTVSLTAPADKATYVSGTDVALTATAADADGTIAKVEFYNGTTLLGTSNASPYGFTWKAVTAGNYQLTAKAYDDKGASTVSTIVNITVSNAAVNQPPTVSLTAPADKATYVSGTDVALTATAADADGTIAKVEFYNGSTLLGTSNASPYGFTWKAVTAGNYQLTAKAYDDKGASTVSTIVNITVSNAAVNQPPTVSLTAPADKATYVSGTDVALTATAADADGTIAKVEFYNGTTLLGTSNASPYGFTWKAVTAGNYQLTAKAYDDKGSSTVSTIVNITVSDAAVNQPPTVSLTAPADKATYVSGTDVALTATAADADGTIAKVEFYNGTTLLGTSNASPYGFTWKAVTSGNYQLTAKAYDDKGSSTVSNIVNIVVMGDHVPFPHNQDIIVSKTFSPNGDGIDDYWQIEFIEQFPHYHISVFDRYGKKVMEAMPYTNRWDGMINGNHLPAEAYYYVIKDNSTGENKKIGSITLLR